MDLSKEDIEKFKAIYLKCFKENLSDDETADKARRFLNIFRAIYQPYLQRNKRNENQP